MSDWSPSLMSRLSAIAAALTGRAPAQTETAEEFEVVEPPKLMARAFRRPFFRHGSLLLEDGQRIDVAVKDLSVGGARVEYYVRTELPERVLLCEPTLRLRCRAKVVWQIEGAAGLCFVQENSAAA
jgi:hypothetical protein